MLNKLTVKTNKSWLYLAGITLLAFVVRIALANIDVFKVDLVTYQFWSLDLVKHGFSNFYNIADSDYPPGYLYILWFFGKGFYWLLNHSILLDIDLIYKLPGIGADLINVVLAYLLVKEYRSDKEALIVASIFAFYPAMIIDSTMWGQVDGLMTCFLLASSYLVIKNYWLGGAVLLAFAQTFKPVAVLCLPLLLIYLWKNNQKLRILGFCLVFGFTVLALFVPFTQIDNLFSFMVQRFLVTATRYPQLTINAFNWWAIFSISPEGITRLAVNELSWIVNARILGYLFFLFLYIPQLIALYRSKKPNDPIGTRLIKSIAITYLAMFVFFTGMHERHMYYGIAFALLLLPVLKFSGKLQVISLGIIYTLNLIYAYRLITPTPLNIDSTMLMILSLVNVLLLLLLGVNWKLFRRLVNVKKI